MLIFLDLFVSGPPEPPLHCNSSVSKTQSIVLSCSPGFDGGLDQQFCLNLLALPDSSLVINRTSHTPQFTLQGKKLIGISEIMFYDTQDFNKTRRWGTKWGSFLSILKEDLKWWASPRLLWMQRKLSSQLSIREIQPRQIILLSFQARFEYFELRLDTVFKGIWSERSNYQSGSRGENWRGQCEIFQLDGWVTRHGYKVSSYLQLVKTFSTSAAK